VGSADAVELLREFREAAAAAGTGLDELWTLVDLGDVLALGDRAGAIDALTAAARFAAVLGASSEAALVKRRLRVLGVHSVSPARAVANSSPLGGLTRRERDVAYLAAKGARNCDIAQTLFISPKTVEQHVSHIYLKLGVRNRAELSSRYGAQLIAATGAART
jgi:DNA-binding NarL/FixJ family response regulator